MSFYIFIGLLIVAAVVCIAAASAYEKEKRKRRETFIENYRFPEGVEKKLLQVYPTLTEQELILVFRGLRDYFQICLMAKNRMISMPSKVVDAAWHEFILFTNYYRTFCQSAFGKYLDHTPAEGMTDASSLQLGMKRVWKLSCSWEDIDPKSPDRLPLLFEIDMKLNIPNGMKYSLDDEEAKKDDVMNPTTVVACGSGTTYGTSCSSCVSDSGCSGGDSGCSGGCGGD